MSDTNVKGIFSLIDKVTSPVNGIKKAIKSLSEAFSFAGDKSRKLEKDVGAGTKSLKNAGDEAKKVKFEFQKLGEQASKVGRLAKILGTGLAASVTATVGLFVGLGKSVFDTSAEFEKYEATLTTILGSEAAAKKAMAWVQDFAATTPYEIAGVTEAFVKMNAYGMNAMDGTLMSAGNWASAMGKDINQVVEAFADARTGEFERLKELGVITKSTKDQVTFTFGDLTKTVKKNSTEIQKALREISDTKFAGAMIKQAKTAAGIIGNLKDVWTNFKKSVGEAGVFAHIKQILGGWLDRINQLPKVKLEALAKRWSDALTKLFDVIFQIVNNIDWPKLIDDFTKFIEGFSQGAANVKKFIDDIGGFGTIINIVVIAAITNLVAGIFSLASAFGVLTIAAGPWFLLAAAIGSIAFLIWRNWAALSKWFTKMWQSWGLNLSIAFGFIDPIIVAASLILGAWKPVAEFFSKLLPNISKASSAKPSNLNTGGLGAPSQTAKIGSQAVNVGGQIEVRAAPGTQVTSVKSNNQNIAIDAYHGLQGVY